MLVYDSTGKLVDLQGDEWNSGNLPLGYFATPGQLESATGIKVGAGGLQGRPAILSDPYNPTAGFTNSYDSVSVPAGTSGYAFDYTSGKQVAHQPSATIYINPNATGSENPYSLTQTGDFTQAFTPPPPNDPTQLGSAASLTPPPPPVPVQAAPTAIQGQPAVTPPATAASAPGTTPNPALANGYQVTLGPTPTTGITTAPTGPYGQYGSLQNYISSFGGTQASAHAGFLSDFNPLSSATFGSPFFGLGSSGDTNILDGNSGGGGGGGTTTDGARNLQGEGANTLAALVALAPQMFSAYQQFSPQYAATDLNNLKTTLFGSFDSGAFETAHPGFEQAYRDLQAQGEIQGWTPAQFAAAYIGKAANDPSLLNFYSGGQVDFNQRLTDIANQQTVSSNTALRTGNVNDAANLGGQALDTMKALNPNLYASLNQANTQASGGITTSPYQTRLGASFDAGPTYLNLVGGTINPNSVSATNNPLLGTANAQAQNLGSTGLGSDLSSMARQQLALGGSLSDEQKRNATQAAREAFASRGLINSNSAVAQEVLNRDAYSQQLLGQRQNFAQGVNQLEQNQQGLNNSYLLNALNANFSQGAQNLQAGLANQENNYNTQLATQQLRQQAQMANQQAQLQSQQQYNSLGTTLAGLDYSRQQQNFGNTLANAQLQSANAFNPFATITSAGAANQGTNPALYGQGASVTSGATGNQNVMNMFNPFNSYASDFYNTNYNAAISAQNSAANNNAAQNSALIGGGATLGAAALIAL